MLALGRCYMDHDQLKSAIELCKNTNDYATFIDNCRFGEAWFFFINLNISFTKRYFYFILFLDERLADWETLVEFL